MHAESNDALRCWCSWSVLLGILLGRRVEQMIIDQPDVGLLLNPQDVVQGKILSTRKLGRKL